VVRELSACIDGTTGSRAFCRFSQLESDMSRMRTLVAGLAFVVLCATATAQFPDLIYYKFNEGTGVGGTTANIANPGAGSPNATVSGQTLAPTGGQFDGCLVGATPASTANFVDTGWTTSLGTGSWTISYWADVSTIATGTLYYVFGDSTAGGFRCFYNGAAGVGNVMLRGGGLTDVIVPGAGTAPGVVTFVHDATVPETRGYLDGALVVTTPQGAPNVSGTASFRVGGYSGGNWTNGALLDEFRVWGSALSPGDVAATWNVTLFDRNILSISQSGPGVGDITVSIGNLTPTGDEGWVLLSGATGGTAGAGPVLGIVPDAITWAGLGFAYFPGNPFHFRVSDIGVFPNVPFMAGPGAVSGLSGQTFDFVALFLTPGGQYDSKTNDVVRYQFQ
jgi:hypothetical protein